MKIVSANFKSKGDEIFNEIEKAKSILLHCHPSPDPDSVGSALAMKFAIEQIWEDRATIDTKRSVTVIRGDSEIPKAFLHFPGAESILQKNFFEIDPKEFDLFIVLDSGINGISRLPERGVVFPSSLKIINIDHHRTNQGCGFINLLDPAYPANCLILFDLFRQWNIRLDSRIASDLFIGAYTDTGGFKYEGVTPRTFEIAGELAKYIPDIPALISKMENCTTPGFLKFEATALESISVYYDGIMAIASVPYSVVKSKGLVEEDIQPSRISSFLRTVPDWKVVACAVEVPAGEVKFSFRSSDSKKYDVSKLAFELGGGGHKAASGATLLLPFDEAVKKVVETAKIIYNI